MNTARNQLFAEEHQSASAIGMYLRCPRSYRFKYISKVPAETRNASMILGIAIHEALAYFYEQLRAGREASLLEMSVLFAEKLQYELSRTDAPPVVYSEKEDPAVLLLCGADLLNAFWQSAERPHQMVEIEMPFNVELVPGARFVGVFDAVVQDADGTYRILEHKTAAKRWTADRIANDLQVSLYTEAATMLGFGDARVDIQLLLKTKTPAFEVVPAPRSRRDLDDALELLAGVSRAAEEGIFYAVRDWQCNGCAYASLCLCGEPEVKP